jgi:hypothetical protein
MKPTKGRWFDGALSGVLGEERVQAMGHAVRVYLEPGKLGYHGEVLEGFRG